MTARSLHASVIISNYNYASFLGAAIESVLGQSYPAVEVIVVDDGSTDESPDVIARYAGQVTPIFTDHSGQLSAFNAGVDTARGDVIYFLDADDLFVPETVERTISFFDVPGTTSKVHWPLTFIDEFGRPRGDVVPDKRLGAGDLRDFVLENGPDSYVSPPTSGNAWARSLIEEQFPIATSGRSSEIGFFIDIYLSMFAPFHGRVERFDEPLGSYRVHGENWYSQGVLDDATLDRFIQGYEARCEALAAYCRERGLPVDPSRWQGKSWSHQFWLTRREIVRAVPAHASFALIDDQTLWNEVGEGRGLIRFLERDGLYYGPPEDDAAAFVELDRIRALGVDRVVIAWCSFWWLDEYPSFAEYLETNCRRTFESTRLIVYEFR